MVCGLLMVLKLQTTRSVSNEDTISTIVVAGQDGLCQNLEAAYGRMTKYVHEVRVPGVYSRENIKRGAANTALGNVPCFQQ